MSAKLRRMKLCSTIAMTMILTAALGALGCKKDEAKPKAGEAPATGASPVSNRKPGKGMPTKGDCDNLGALTSKMSMQQTPPGTTDEQKQQLQAMSDEAGAAIARRCMADGWSGEAVSCGLTEKDPSTCDKFLTDDQRSKMQTEVQAIFAKGMQAMGEPPAAAGSVGIAECDAFIAVVVSIGQCDKADDATKQGAQAGLEAMALQFEAAATMDDKAKAALGANCKTAADSFQQTAKSLGCTP